jgi:hypothetical protein
MPSVEDESQFRTVGLSGYWHRLIPSRFPTIDIYRRVAPPELWPLASAIETATNPRARLKEKLTKNCERHDTIPPKLQNWNHAPFAYRNPDGSRFLGEDYGVLELFDNVQTALAVSIRKRESFLSATKMPPLDLEMRVLKHEVKGSFTDLSGVPVDTAQAVRWSLGEHLLNLGAAGVRYRCAERPSGLGLAIFDPETLGPSIQTQHYKFRWDGKRISEVYNYRDENDGRPLISEEIFAESPLRL